MSSVESTRRNPAARDQRGRKQCSKCTEWKSIDQYSVQIDKSDGLRPSCTTCERERKLLARYGITLEEYKAILAKQNGVCAICLEPSDKSLHVDHDHNCCPGRNSCGKCVRSFLCSNCNTAIGLMEDNPDRLIDAAMYLMSYRNILA